MPPGIVNDLKAIEIKQHHRKAKSGIAASPLDRSLQPVKKEGAIGQLRQRIMQSAIFQLQLHAVLFRNIAKHHHRPLR